MSKDGEVHVRPLREDDYGFVIERIDDWWGGRSMAAMLPRLFFQHFADTSFAATDDHDVLLGFLCGFVSQSRPGEAYIHFVGVDPAVRGGSVGRALYEAFFTAARARACTVVRCVTAPVNEGSRRFHERMGFEFTLAPDYDGRGGDRLTMSRSLTG